MLVYMLSTPLGAGNLEADCRLLAPEEDDFRFAPGSPCRDAGDPADSMQDLDGSRNDPGAFGGPGGGWVPLPPEPDG
jgi:hypothetical protein